MVDRTEGKSIRLPLSISEKADTGVAVPWAYVLARDAQSGLVQTALAAFAITPLSCVLFSDEKDYPLACQFSSDVILRTHSEIDSIEFALGTFEQTQMPSLIIGTWQGIAAVHSDGRMEDLPWQAADLLPN